MGNRTPRTLFQRELIFLFFMPEENMHINPLMGASYVKNRDVEEVDENPHEDCAS